MCSPFSTVSTLGVLFPYLVTGLLAENWELVNQPVLLWDLYTQAETSAMLPSLSQEEGWDKRLCWPQGTGNGQKGPFTWGGEFIAGRALAVGG